MTSNLTQVHPLAVGVCLVAGILILVLPRKYAFVPLLVAALIMPLQQRLIIATLDFTLVRILILFGFVRILVKSEHKWLTLNSIDKAMILWVLARIISYTLLWQTYPAFINRLGGSFDALGIYFLARILVRDLGEITRLVKALVVVCVLAGFAMLNEQITQRNFFSVFGGVPETTLLRDGNLRSQGAFAHPILAGTFGATLLPIFWGLRLWHKKAAVLGLAAALVITWTSSSSGPVLAGLAGLIGLSAWVTRKRMRAVRWGIVFALVSLHIIMKAPVWALLWRVSIFGGSTGFHRYLLVDQFLKRFSEWWLVGTSTTAHWGYYMFDVTNMYVRVGVDGGLVTLIFFVAIIAYCFRAVGCAVQRFEDDLLTQKFLWAFGASLFAHAISFIGVPYWDQTVVLWYWLLAMIAAFASLDNKVHEESQAVRKSGIFAQPSFLGQAT